MRGSYVQIQETMTDARAAVVYVQYRFMEGYHVFTSKDVEGLYVASQDPRKAYESLKPAIELLIRENEGINCEIEHAVSLPEFLEDVRSQREEVEVPHPATLKNTKFVLRCVN
jgi:hypothetical protein